MGWVGEGGGGVLGSWNHVEGIWWDDQNIFWQTEIRPIDSDSKYFFYNCWNDFLASTVFVLLQSQKTIAVQHYFID
jgi:hypothetical protein